MVCILASCNPVEERQNPNLIEASSVKKDSSNTYTPAYFDFKNTRLATGYRDTAFVKFSSDTAADCFLLNVPEGLITDTKTTIRIVTKSGKEIYEHTFPTSDLINGYTLDEIKTDAEMESYVLLRAKSLLKEGLYQADKLPEDSYLSQAHREDFNDYEVFNHLKNTGKIIFHYCLNEESHYYMGYSPGKQKVVSIINCC